MISTDNMLKAAHATVEKVEFCVAATVGEGGVAHACVVQRLSFDESFSVSFATDATSRKAAEIKRAGKLTLVFQDDNEGAYVALIGSATLSSDLRVKQLLWVDHLNRWFPEGAETANAVIVTLEPQRIELWNYARSITPEPIGLRAAVLERTGDSWQQFTRI